MGIWTRALAAAVLLTGCGGAEQIAIPAAASIASIQICRNGCKAGKIGSADAAFIAQAVKAAAAFRDGWQTETHMMLTTGTFTTPTPVDTVGFHGKGGGVPLVFWFGPGWMGCAVTEKGERKRYFRKTTEKEVAPLRTALRLQR